MIRDAAGPAAMPARAAGTGPPAAAGPEPARLEPPPPNPSLRIEPALNLVVVEFRDTTGAVRDTLPSAREIEAYRSGAAGPGPAPPALDVTR